MALYWKVGDRIEDNWEILQVLQGGMGRVYIVFDHEWRIKLAAKTFQSEAFTYDPSIKKRFRREALAWIGLDPHPNIVGAVVVKNIGSTPFIFLEYESGGDLGRWIASRRTRRDLPQALRFAIGFCDGINYAYSKGIKAHRDIKPENCLISNDGELKITDFGLASLLRPNNLRSTMTAARPTSPEHPHGERLTQAGSIMGTLPYMAPEQILDASSVDLKADIYAFGVMLFEMLTGKLPFFGRDTNEWIECHLHAPMPSLDNFLPAALRSLVQECTAKVVTDRPANFGVIRERLASMYTSITGQQILVREATPPHSNQLLRKGIGFEALGEHNVALSFFERSIGVDSNNPPAWIGKSYVLSSLKREDEALACADRAVTLNPQDGRAWTCKALSLARLGRLSEALSCAERATSLAPKDWSIWPAKAHILWSLDRNEEAVTACNIGLAIYPVAESLWNCKGRALHSLKKYEEALSCFDAVLEMNPSDSSANLYKGSILVDQCQYELSIPFLDRCLEAVPDSASSTLQRTCHQVRSKCQYNRACSLVAVRESGS